MPGFDLLTPQVVLHSVAQAYDLRIEGTLTPYPSYINRVYGIQDEDGREYVVKFYRPGRWSGEAIEEEHRFLEDCRRAELPVIAPLADDDGETLAEVGAVDGDGNEQDFLFALFPKMGGRNFDAEGEDEWRRLGGLLGRLHLVGRNRPAPHRTVIHPSRTTAPQVAEILDQVHPDLQAEFEDHTRGVLDSIAPAFDAAAMQRIHGDCHRGNILDRPGTGLLLIDFDDMATGPPVQDLWLLLPGRRSECRREIGLIMEGYEELSSFPWESLELIEPLRFMRMIHYIAWCGRQQRDAGFSRHFPDWGTRAYWIRELEDLKDQALLCRA